MELENFDMELASLKLKLNELIDKLDSANKKALTYEKEANKLKKDKIRLDQRYRYEFPSFDDVKDRCKVAETEAKRTTELADKARADAVTSQKEKSESLRLAVERLSQIERAERQAENLERQKIDLEDELDRPHNVNSLGKLLDDECKAHISANRRAEALSLDLQTAQASIDNLHQELAQARLKEIVLDNRIRAAHSPHGKQTRVDDIVDMHIGETSDTIMKTNKRARSMIGDDDIPIVKGDEDFQSHQDNEEKKKIT